MNRAEPPRLALTREALARRPRGHAVSRRFPALLPKRWAVLGASAALAFYLAALAGFFPVQTEALAPAQVQMPLPTYTGGK